MFLIKITLLLFCNLFVQISTTEQTSNETAKTRKSNGNYDECVCFPAGQSLIPELLNPKGYGLERLVVYLYRDTNTNQIKMFLPSPEKLQLIPNIPFEVGDALKTITTESIASLFNINPKYALNQDQILANNLPIGLNMGKIQHNLSPQYLRDYSQQGAIPLPNNGPAVSPNIFSWDSKNPYQPNSVIDLTLPNQINGPIYKQEIYAPGSKATQSGLTFDQWFNRQMAIFQDVKSPGDIKSVNTDVLRSLIQQALFENHMHIGSTGLITDTNGLMIDLNNLQLRPILIGNPVQYQQSLPENQLLELPKHLPYLEGLLITLVYPPKILGVIPLGKIYVAQNALGSANALIEHYFTKTPPAATPASNQPNLFSNIVQPNSNWLNSNPVPPPPVVYSAPGTQIPNSLGLGSAFSNGPQTNGIWRRKSNKHRPSKPKATEPKQPKNAINDFKSWFKRMFGSPFTRKSGSPSNQNWQSPQQWVHNAGLHVSPHSVPLDGRQYTVPFSGNPWSSSWSSVNSNAYPSNQLKASPIFSDPGMKWNSPPVLIPVAVHPKQSQYTNQNTLTLTAHPIIGTKLPHQISNNFLPPPLPGWQPNIGSAQYSSININPAKSPYMRSGPDTSDKEASLGVIPSNKPATVIKPIVMTPNLSYSYGLEITKSTNQSDAQNQNKITSSETVPNDGKPTGGTRRFPMPVIQGVLKTLINMVLQNLSPETLSSAGENRRGGASDKKVSGGDNEKVLATDSGGKGITASEPPSKEPIYDTSINTSNHIQKTGEIEDGEEPDFRIIGGSAATGSGSPLSNKGRSGADS